MEVVFNVRIQLSHLSRVIKLVGILGRLHSEGRQRLFEFLLSHIIRECIFLVRVVVPRARENFPSQVITFYLNFMVIAHKKKRARGGKGTLFFNLFLGITASIYLKQNFR